MATKKYFLSKGQKINHLTMLSDIYKKIPDGSISNRKIKFAIFYCDLCNTIKEQRYHEVSCGRTKSCGCLTIKKSQEAHRKGGLVDKDGYKICSKCKQNKHYTEYYKSSRTSDGYYSTCKSCSKESQMLCIYNLTSKDYNQILLQQNNKCKICNEELSLTKPNLDHNHKDNTVRGILCHHCNILIGHFKENLTTLINAVKYLENNSSLQNYTI